MAGRLLRPLAAGVAVLGCADLVSGSASTGSPSAGGCAVDDGLALHQRALRLRSLEEQPWWAAAQAPVAAAAAAATPRPHRNGPSAAHIAQSRNLVRSTVDNAIRRATKDMKLPDVPAMIRWQLTGKVTQYLMDFYSTAERKPVIGLLDDLIDLSHDVLTSPDALTISGDVLGQRLANITRVFAIARHFVDSVNAPNWQPLIREMMDSVEESVHGNQSRIENLARTSFSSFAEAASEWVVAFSNQTVGPPLADLLAYFSAVSQRKIMMDQAHALELHVPLLRLMKAPPALVDFVAETAENRRKQVFPSPVESGTRIMHMLSSSSDQLGMPPAVGELFETGATEIARAPKKPEEISAALSSINKAMAKINTQFGGPPALSTLIERIGDPAHSRSLAAIAENFNLLGLAASQAGLPVAVGEGLAYAGALVANNRSKPDAARMVELCARMGKELGAPDVFNEFGSGITALAREGGGEVDKAKANALVKQLLVKLKLPNMANVLENFVIPMSKHQKVEFGRLVATVGPSFAQVPSEMDKLGKMIPDMLAANSAMGYNAARKFEAAQKQAFETFLRNLSEGKPMKTLWLRAKSLAEQMANATSVPTKPAAAAAPPAPLPAFPTWLLTQQPQHA